MSIVPKSLSVRLIVLTIAVVMLMEVLVFIPSIAHFRLQYLKNQLERAQIISLTVLANKTLPQELERQLLEKAGVLNIALHRDKARQLILSSSVSQPVAMSYDLRSSTSWQLTRDALVQLFDSKDRYIRVIDHPAPEIGTLIDVTMKASDLRKVMLAYAFDIFIRFLFFAGMIVFVVFLALRYFFAYPIARLINNISNYAKAPEDESRIIQLKAGSKELREAEMALMSLETQLTAALKQKSRLVKLGEAVAKISHDLRNILAVAQILTDRIETKKSASIRRVIPKLMESLNRAISLCEATLAFGKAEEAPPKLARHVLAVIVRDVIQETELLAKDDTNIFVSEVPERMNIRCDDEQLRRILLNLIDNARKAGSGDGVRVIIKAEENDEEWRVFVVDNGPGLSELAQKNLFVAFQGGTSKGGAGLGLVISAELARGHGGNLELVKTGPEGTCFVIIIPKKTLLLGESALGRDVRKGR